jgi:hypothetical protein
VRRAALAVALCLLAPASAGAGGTRPSAALSASPTRVGLAGNARTTIRVWNPGAERVVVDVGRAPFALDVRGRPRIASRSTASAARWLTVRPRRLTLAPGAAGALVVTSRLPRRPEPGDHPAVVLLTTRPQLRGSVAVRMRVGVVVTVRAPGKVVRRVAVRGLHVRHRRRACVLELALANRGNVTESLPRGVVRVYLRRRGRVVARLVADPRELLPRTRGVAQLHYRGRLRGRVTARAVVAVGGRRLRRTFAITL